MYQCSKNPADMTMMPCNRACSKYWDCVSEYEKQGDGSKTDELSRLRAEVSRLMEANRDAAKDAQFHKQEADRAKAERDAAIKDLNFYSRTCETCTGCQFPLDIGICGEHQWRGMCAENTPGKAGEEADANKSNP